MNILWNLSCGRKLHAQQQEFQTVVECIDKVTQFMSRAAIFSFMPILTKVLPESVTNIERGRYYRNRFHEISEKWIREHRQDYRGNRTGDLQDVWKQLRKNLMLSAKLVPMLNVNVPIFLVKSSNLERGLMKPPVQQLLKLS